MLKKSRIDSNDALQDRLKPPSGPSVILFNIFIFLAFFEIPVFGVGKDFVGLYDFYVVGYLIYLLFAMGRKRAQFPRIWIDFTLIYICYIGYLLFNLVLSDSTRSELIVAKTIEYLIAAWIVIINIHAFRITPVRIGRYLLAYVLLLAIFQLGSWAAFYGHVPKIRPGLGYGSWYRIGLPFMVGTSSNPAGFVLMVFLVYFIATRNPGVRAKGLFVLDAIFATLALFLTVSRTNIIAFLLFLAFASLRQYLFRHNLKARFIVTSGLIVLAIGLLILPFVIPPDSRFYLFVKIIANPSAILQDQSFKLRYGLLWVQQISDWLQSFQSIFIGRGLNFYPVTDSTYFGLLVNQGVIGFLFFMTIWVAFPLLYARSFVARAIVLVTLVNAINADTLTVSYRAVQVFVLVFVLSFYEGSLRRRR